MAQKRWQFFTKLRVRLLLLILFILLPALLLAGYTASQQRAQASINVQGNAFLLAQLASGTQKEVIDSTEQILTALSQLPILQLGDGEACTPLFVSLREKFSRYTNFYMIDTKGDTVCTGLPDAAPVNVFERQWFQRGMAARAFSMADFEIGAVTRRPIVTMSYPIFDESGAIKYLIAAGLDLRWVGEFINETRLPPDTMMIAVDRNGKVLYRHPDPDGKWIGRNESSNPLILEVLTKRNGTIESSALDGVDRLYGFTALDVNNYSAFVLVGIPQSVAYGPSNRLLVVNVFALGMIGAVALLVAWSGTANFVINPIHRLIGSANLIAGGNLTEQVQLARFENTEELGTLTFAFNRMAAALEQREKALTRSNRDLEEARQGLEVKVKERTTELAVQITARQQAEDRALFLRDLAIALSEAVTPQQVANVIAQQGLLAANGHMALVVQLTEDGQHIEFLNDNPLAVQDAQRITPVDVHAPLTDVVRTGESLWIESLEDYIQLYPFIGEATKTTTGSQASAVLPLVVNEQTIGGMALSFKHPRRFLQEERDFLTTLAGQCGQALERSRLYEAEKRARLVAEDARQRLVFLTEAGALLSSSLDYQVTLDRLVDLAVPRLAEWCHVDVLQDERVVRVAAAHVEPEKVELLFEMNRLFPAKLESNSGAGKVIRTGQSEMISESPQIDLSAYAQGPKHLELLNKFTTRSYIISPLTARGRTFGAMTLAFSSAVNRRYNETDLSMVEELTKRAALALDNARLYALEQGLRESAQQALARAEEADRLKLKFLAMISHELRTPLTSIKGFVTTLLADDVEWDDESRDSFMRIINEEADKLTDLIEQLLDLSRIQAGTLRIAPEIRPLHSVFDTAMAQLNVLTENHHLKVIVPEDLPPVYVDFQRIAQVIVNLVGNAVRYTSMGTSIIVAAFQHDGFIQVDVADQGPGIPPEKRELVFEAFRQADDKSKKGAGLGLAICRGLVEAHQGQIWIQDKNSPGTTVSFTLPVAK